MGAVPDGVKKLEIGFEFRLGEADLKTPQFMVSGTVDQNGGGPISSGARKFSQRLIVHDLYCTVSNIDPPGLLKVVQDLIDRPPG